MPYWHSDLYQLPTKTNLRITFCQHVKKNINIYYTTFPKRLRTCRIISSLSCSRDAASVASMITEIVSRYPIVNTPQPRGLKTRLNHPPLNSARTTLSKNNTSLSGTQSFLFVSAQDHINCKSGEQQQQTTTTIPPPPPPSITTTVSTLPTSQPSLLRKLPRFTTTHPAIT